MTYGSLFARDEVRTTDFLFFSEERHRQAPFPQPGGEIRVWGSTGLIRTLAAHDLIDEYRLAVYPLVLGTGKKLFSDGFALTRLALAESRALRSGVLINTYRRSDEGATRPLKNT